MLMTSERISFVFYCEILSITDQSYLTNIMINEIHNKIKFVNLKQAKYNYFIEFRIFNSAKLPTGAGTFGAEIWLFTFKE